MSAITQGRQDLARWRESVPDNFFTCDANLQRVLPLYDPGYASYAAELAAFGHAVATVIDPAAAINDRPHNHPRLDAWDGIGQRTESIEFHPSYHDAGRPAYEAGLLALSAEPGHAVQQSALFYLLTQAGEMGHACPIVCTLGLIRALQAKGSSQLQATYLPPLLDRNYDRKQTASQFLTEVQGGSDVGANAVEARPAAGDDGVWLLRGEKWFCSVANADQMLVTARPAGAAEGTRGLGTFLVPRRLPDGSLNAFHIRRLKTKFGTRTMASGEIDFTDAVAYPIGGVDEGFKIVVELVLNTSAGPTRWARPACCAAPTSKHGPSHSSAMLSARPSDAIRWCWRRWLR
jgi:acyl-CoA dehydrogenase